MKRFFLIGLVSFAFLAFTVPAQAIGLGIGVSAGIRLGFGGGVANRGLNLQRGVVQRLHQVNRVHQVQRLHQVQRFHHNVGFNQFGYAQPALLGYGGGFAQSFSGRGQQMSFGGCQQQALAFPQVALEDPCVPQMALQAPEPCVQQSFQAAPFQSFAAPVVGGCGQNLGFGGLGVGVHHHRQGIHFGTHVGGHVR